MKTAVTKTYIANASLGPKKLFKRGHCTGPHIVITNPPPGLSCAKLKRLVEIAAMDEEKLWVIIRNALMRACDPKVDYPPYESDPVELVLQSLGLSAAQARKGRK